MTRRRKNHDEVNRERWVVSYADFITLLLAFFVVMYSISSVNEGKYRVLSESLSGVFRGTEYSLDPIQIGDIPRPLAQRDIGLLDENPSIAPSAPQESDARLSQLADDARKHFQELIADGELSVSSNRHWLEIEIGAGVLFPSGSAQPLDGAFVVLESIAGLLSPYANPVHVEGFTDDKPIESDRFPSNWELSAARAAAVVRVLEHYGIASKRMAVVGFGQHQPKVSNRSERGRQLNRRVKIVVSRDAETRQMVIGEARQTAQASNEGTAVKSQATDQGILFTQQRPN